MLPLLSLLSLAVPAPLHAFWSVPSGGTVPGAPQELPEGAASDEPWPATSRTRHSVELGGQTVSYTAEAGTLALAEEDGTETAHVFYVAYVRDTEGGEDLADRPITFTFNGGPGSSSVWLHMGAFGPRRVRMDPEGFPLAPPGELVDNDFSLLDFTDLVFIDPVTTGYSRAAEDEDPQQFHGVDEDVESVGEFIRRYTTRARRWSSPKYLCGESYGTTRAAGLVQHLQGRHGMYFNGVVLVSSILQFQTARFDVGNDLPYLLFLPTYAATAWYHGQLGEEFAELDALLQEVETFALGEYATALLRGNRLSADERRAIAERVARYTGLSADYVEQSNLRIQIHRFVKELRRDERLTVGRLDSRFTGLDRDAAQATNEYDPSYAAIQGPYTSALNDYVRSELGYENDLTYEILSGRVQPWSYGSAKNRYLNVAEDLREAMARNRNLRVFVASGYYDLATPYFATHYTFDHLAMDPGYLERVSMAHYESGHMMYIHLEAGAQLRRDLQAFYAASGDGHVK